jgi:hypothetical protein
MGMMTEMQATDVSKTKVHPGMLMKTKLYDKLSCSVRDHNCGSSGLLVRDMSKRLIGTILR